MANTDKNIVITPNVGQAGDPKIVFSGASATLGPQNITLNIYPTDGGTLSFEGSAGQLFSLTNSLSGTIYSVNDVSGIPSIEVLDTGLVKLAQYGGNVVLGSGTDNGVDKLQVNGGISTPTMWVNNSISNNNGYNENIRLFPATNNVSTIAFGATGTSGTPWNSLLGYSDRFEIRQGSQWQLRTYANYTHLYGPLKVGTYAPGVVNTDEALIGRVTDRSLGTLTIQLGNDATRVFEVVDKDWTTQIFVAGMTNFTYKGNQILHAGNYNSYAPTLTGGGASGTWDISITGNATTASTAAGLSATLAVASGGTGVTTSTGSGSVVLSTNSTLTALKEVRVAMAANNIDLNLANYFSKTISGVTTLTVSNIPPSGTATSFILDLINGGSSAITWWTNLRWVSGTAPTLTAAGRDVLGFFTYDGGSIWTGLVLGKNLI